jgi:hypothetical protein
MTYHGRRSDVGIVQGEASEGFPDVVAVHPVLRRFAMLELKSARGVVTPGQLRWIMAARWAGIDARVVRPADYDELLRAILVDRTLGVVQDAPYGDAQPGRPFPPSEPATR